MQRSIGLAAAFVATFFAGIAAADVDRLYNAQDSIVRAIALLDAEAQDPALYPRFERVRERAKRQLEGAMTSINTLIDIYPPAPPAAD